MFKDLTAATESLDNLFMEGEDGGSQEVTVDLEIQVTEDAVEPIEEAVEAEEVVDDTTETVEEMLGNIERMEHNRAVVEEFGWSRALAMVIDPTNEIAKFAPAMPAVESLDVTGSPNSAETVMAVEGFKEAMKSFWEWIKKMARKIWEAISSFGRAIINLVTSYDKQAQRLAKALKGASIDSKKLGEKSASLMKKADWDTKAKAFDSVASSVSSKLGAIRNMQIANAETATFSPDSFGSLEALGLKYSDNSLSVSGDAMKGFAGSEMKVSESGWGASDFTAAGLTKITSVMKSKLTNAVKEIEGACKRLEADASSAEKDEDKKEAAKKGAKAKLKALNMASKIVKQLNTVGAKLCKAYMKAGYAVYSCKASKSE